MYAPKNRVIAAVSLASYPVIARHFDNGKQLGSAHGLCGLTCAVKCACERRSRSVIFDGAGLAEQLVVLGVRADPEPHETVSALHCDRAIVASHAR